MKSEESYKEWIVECLTNATSEKERREWFLTKTCDIMEENGDLPDGFTQCFYQDKKNSGATCKYIDAFSFSQESLEESAEQNLQSQNVLRLIYVHFDQPDKLLYITKENYERAWKRLLNLYKKLTTGTYDSINEGHPLTELRDAAKKQQEIAKKQRRTCEVKFILLTNQLCRHEQPKAQKINNTIITYECWDISRIITYECWDISRIQGTDTSHTVVDFSRFGGLPCLKVDLGEGVDIYDSYLLTIPGEALARCYKTHGDKLLEHNVRVYLQNKGKVNKGMRDTLLNEPFLFFVYNNGLAITAQAVETNDDNSRILKLHNMQVVNGGQTMASIFNAWNTMKDKERLQKVTVQAKLTVISDKLTSNLVPSISKYSNTQNAVQATDLDSNSKVQQWLENKSRRIATPDGKFWYYERVRGQYQNAQLYLTQKEKMSFKIKYPTQYKIDKKSLAKAIMAYELVPQLVSKGAEKTFTGTREHMGFGHLAETLWLISRDKFTEILYQQCIAKMILFNATDKIAATYCKKHSTYKASIRAYLVSMLISRLREENKSLNLDLIWKMHDITKPVYNMLVSACEVISECIERSGQVHRLQEWLKSDGAWQYIQKSIHKITVDYSYFGDLQPISSGAPDFLGDELSNGPDYSKWTDEQKDVMLHFPTKFWSELDTYCSVYLKMDKTTKKLLDERINQEKTLSHSNCVKLLTAVTAAKKSGWKYSEDENFANVSIKSAHSRKLFANADNKTVLVVGCSCDGKWLSPGYEFLQDKVYKMLTKEKHQLGDILTQTSSEGKRFIFCFIKNKSNSVFFWPAFSTCMQEVKTFVSDPADKIYLTYWEKELGQKDAQTLRRAIHDNMGGRNVTVIVERQQAPA